EIARELIDACRERWNRGIAEARPGPAQRGLRAAPVRGALAPAYVIEVSLDRLDGCRATDAKPDGQGQQRDGAERDDTDERRLCGAAPAPFEESSEKAGGAGHDGLAAKEAADVGGDVIGRGVAGR